MMQCVLARLPGCPASRLIPPSCSSRALLACTRPLPAAPPSSSTIHLCSSAPSPGAQTPWWKASCALAACTSLWTRCWTLPAWRRWRSAACAARWSSCCRSPDARRRSATGPCWWAGACGSAGRRRQEELARHDGSRGASSALSGRPRPRPLLRLWGRPGCRGLLLLPRRRSLRRAAEWLPPAPSARLPRPDPCLSVSPLAPCRSSWETSWRWWRAAAWCRSVCGHLLCHVLYGPGAFRTGLLRLAYAALRGEGALAQAYCDRPRSKARS